MLAAYEVRKRWPASRIVVYTFGAPRYACVSPFRAATCMGSVHVVGLRVYSPFGAVLAH